MSIHNEFFYKKIRKFIKKINEKINEINLLNQLGVDLSD